MLQVLHVGSSSFLPKVKSVSETALKRMLNITSPPFVIIGSLNKGTLTIHN